MMESFWTTMANHLWQTSALILLILGLERALKQAPGRWLERLWLVALGALVVPAGWLDFGLYWSRPEDLKVAQLVWTLPAQIVDVSGATTGAAILWPVLTSAWLIGVFYHWILLFRNLEEMNHWSDHSLNHLNSPDLLGLTSSLEIPGLPVDQVRWTSESMMPMVVGLWRPRIVLPLSLIRTMDPEQLRAVLLHEDSHRRRRDPLRLLAYSLIQSILFFHPLWPLVQRRLKDASEFICDENSLTSGLTGRRYAQTLAGALALNLKSPHLSATAGLSSRTSLSARILRFDLNGRNESMLKYSLLLSLALGLLISGVLISAGCQADSPVEDEAVPRGLIEGDRPYLSEEKSEIIDEQKSQPNLTFWAKPDYPESCRKDGISGEVKVKILVNAEGIVEKAEVMEGPECLRESALKAARKCQFVAATQVGVNVKAWVMVPYVFKLE